MWPYFYENRDLLAAAMGASSAAHGWTWQEQIENAFTVLAMFPKAPR